jgi:transposase
MSDITCVQIIRTFVVGERDLDVLASYRDVRRHASAKTIKAALNGNDRAENIFALTQSLDLCDFYQTKMLDCDRNVEAVLDARAVEKDHTAGPLLRARTKRTQVKTPSFGVRAALLGVLGVDLTQIHGLGLSLSLKLVGECGTDLRAWSNAKHFTSWLCLAPSNKISPLGTLLRNRLSTAPQHMFACVRGEI